MGVLHQAIDGPDLGLYRGLRIEWPANHGSGDLARHVFPRLVDLVRALLGEVEALSAIGDPPGPRPVESLVVQLRCPGTRRAEIRIEKAQNQDEPAPGRLVVNGAEGSLSFEFPPDFAGPARLILRTSRSEQRETQLDSWDPHAALLATLEAACAQQGAQQGRNGNRGPNLLDGTRAMELSEAVVRSLKRGRTVDLHYEEISEAGTFKGVMTSVGCVILLAILVILPIALMGPALGYPGTIGIAYAIPPVLILFIVLQLLRFGMRERSGGRADAAERV
jgi:myo-inositol 2-dehydrogenase/D-chiro-inositol 1-dehydrogenase